jgi:hypothetical protein
VTALIDWRDDAALPTRTASWPAWTLAMFLVAVVAAAIIVAVIGSASGVSTSTCRLHEAREGIPSLEKMDVPSVGQRVPPSWLPPKNVRVRYTTSAGAASGSVTDETMCGQPTGQLLVTIAR